MAKIFITQPTAASGKHYRPSPKLVELSDAQAAAIVAVEKGRYPEPGETEDKSIVDPDTVESRDPVFENRDPKGKK